jgi:D-alanyl-D-alanine carboxypeptidase
MIADRNPRLLHALPVLLLAVSVIGAACSSDTNAPGSNAARITPSNTGTAATNAGYSTACSNETVQVGTDGKMIAQIVEQAVTDNGLASALYRVMKGGELIAGGALGDSMTGVPADQSMHFRNGNVAFGYMGTLLLLMNENGEVGLDDPVSKWLPDLDLPNADKVTLAMLAYSTSGYPDYVPNDTFVNAFLNDPFKQFTPQDLIDIGLSTPPWYEPGTAWNYAHTNYVILGEALAAAGGKPLGDLLTERVIETIGLTDTAPVLTPAMPEPVLHTFSTERGVFEETTFWNPSWQTAPGSVIATNICDMVASAAAIGTGLLLTNELYERMIARATAELGPPPASCPEDVCRQFSDTTYYGLGVIIMSDWIVQTPMFGGQGGVHAYLPSEDLAVAIVAVTGQNSKPNTNYAQQIWQSIATELTPDNVPLR